MSVIRYFACRGQDIDKLIDMSSSDILTLKLMAQENDLQTFNLIKDAIKCGYLEAKNEIAKAMKENN